MDTFLYILISASVFGSIFLLGWQFGCWMVQREQSKGNRDCYTDLFYNDYYAGSSCKNKSLYTKPKKKAKKTSKK